MSERYLHTRTSFPLNFFELIPRFSSPPLLAPVFILRDPEPHFDVSDVMETFPPHVNWWRWWRLLSLNPAPLAVMALHGLLWTLCTGKAFSLIATSETKCHQREIKTINTEWGENKMLKMVLFVHRPCVCVCVWVCLWVRKHRKRGPLDIEDHVSTTRIINNLMNNYSYFIAFSLHCFKQICAFHASNLYRYPLNACFCGINDHCANENKTQRRCLIISLQYLTNEHLQAQFKKVALQFKNVSILTRLWNFVVRDKIQRECLLWPLMNIEFKTHFWSI